MTETRNDGTTPLEWSTIEARGDDALTFLQGQISQDLMQVHDVGAWALLLAPDSVVLAACFVAKASDGYDLTLPAALADAGLTRLKRFLLRTKCTLEVKESTPGPFATEKDRIDARWPGV